MTKQTYPDPLTRPEPARIQSLLEAFWRQLNNLPDLLNRGEQLLAERSTAALRDQVIEMMLALNGIQWPADTCHLNSYLGASQRAAIEKTLVAPEVNTDSWIGRAVALVVIYRWYAPQLVEKYNLIYPEALETEVWVHLQAELPDWPLTVTTG
ncbi:MAG: hypothetical protein U0350_18435 [Caldilineaceae bacterium]